MKNLFEPAAAAEVKGRLARMQPDSLPLWGKMTREQALAHCSAALELALGDRIAQPMFIGRMVGRLVKPLLLRNDEPMRRNSPTMRGFAVTDERDLGIEQERLERLIERFSAAGPKGCTSNPHSFFGRLTPEEWAILMYKHLDHHLRQFGL
jgi:hypothetical protein